MKKNIKWLMNPPLTAPNSVLLLRFLVGSIFFWEGVLKFVYTNQGVGRFTKLGLPFPEFSADVIAGFEIIGGIFIILGLFSRITSLAFAGEMLVAIWMTKVVLFSGISPLPLPQVPPKIGGWAFLHEVRTDYALLVLSLFIAWEGPGKKSLDYKLKHRNKWSETLS
jgi:putative oxidoreductase